MTPIAEYQIKEEFIRLLLIGPPGSGKTTTVCGFPNGYVLDLDVNLGGALRFLKARNQPLPLGYDRVDINEKGEVVPPLLRWQRLEALISNSPPEVETIVIDSATGLTDLLMQEVKRQQPSVKDGRQLYMFYLEAGKQFLNKFVLLRKHVVLTAHEKIEQDAMTGITQYRVAWPGQLGDYVGAFFTNVWRCEVDREGIPPKYKYVIRTMQDTQHYGLKNDLELPPIFQFDWMTIQAKLNA
jgi:hypothetical protein